MVTKRFEKVIDKVGKLPAEEQRWQKSFAGSQDLLEKMADKALQDHERGKTEPLDLSEL